MNLNPTQKAAVEHKDSPLLVVAGPGSGKTRLVIERILHMLQNGIKPSEILCLTFSEKAAEEMMERLEKKGVDVADMDIGTFHAFCKQILDDHMLESGISTSSGTMSRAAQLVWGMSNTDDFKLEHINIGHNAQQVITSIIDGISTFKKELVGPEQLEKFLASQKNEELSEDGRDFMNKLEDLCKVYYKYQKYQRDHALIDFDDMIVESINLLKSNESVLQKYQNKYKHVFVDEFQDNNFAQLELVKLIAKDGNITVVGDDDQCIYRFQGAYLTNFNDFKSHYENTTIANLDQNYRSTENIVTLANSCLQGQENRQEKNLFSTNEKGELVGVIKCSNESAEVEFVVKQIKELVGKPIKRRDGSDRVLEYKDFTILSRRRMDGKKFANALKGLGIPAYFTGESDIFSSPIVRDLMANLKIARSPGTAGVEINRLLINHGISDHNIAKINRAARNIAHDDDTGIDFVLETMKNVSELDVTQKEEITDLVNQIDRVIETANTSSISNLVYQIMMSISDLFQRALVNDSAQNRRYQSLLKEIFIIAQEFETLNPDATLTHFIEYLYKVGKFELDIEDINSTSNSVQITTIHQSKGKQFPVVFIVDVATNKLPLRHREKVFYVPNELSQGVQTGTDAKELHIQEERRLLYVAMTRAQNQLYISYCSKYGQNIRESKPSKFLDELKFQTNPLIEFQTFEGTQEGDVLQEIDKIEKIKQDKQYKANRAINKMQLQSAVKKILELGEIDYYEKHGKLDGFDPSEILSVTKDDSDIESQLQGEKIPLIDKDSLRLSKSKLEVFDKCPLKFKFQYVLKVPTLPSSAADAGTTVHDIIETITKYQIDGKKVTKKEALDMLDKSWESRAFENDTASNQKKEDAKTWLETFFAWSDANPNTPVAVEKPFSLEIGGVKFTGKIDRVEKTPSGKYVVIDYKTGSAKVTKNTIGDDLQMNIYAMATEKLYKELPEKTVLFYLAKDKLVENKILESKVNEVKESIENSVGLILDEQFPANPQFKNCNYCDFWDICEEKEVNESS